MCSVPSSRRGARHVFSSWALPHDSPPLSLSPIPPCPGTAPWYLAEQGNTLYENVWNAFLPTLPDYPPGRDWRLYLDPPAYDKSVLVIPGDIPLATPDEIDAFVDGCDLSRYDY